jgi:hypothetical protein
VNQQGLSTTREGFFPPKGASAASLRSYVDESSRANSTYRIDLLREWGLSKNYIESNQWVTIDARGNPRTAWRWTQQDPAEDIPKPIHNKILELVDNEVGKLSRRQSKPYVRPRASGSEGKKGGARKGNEVLNWHLEKIRWGRLRYEGIYKNVVYGVGLWKSYWELDYKKTVKVGVPDAVKCSEPTCNFVLVEPKLPLGFEAMVPPEKRDRLAGSPLPSENGLPKTQYTAKACLQCDEPKPLELAKLLPDEAKGSDTYGRPLGKDVPVGDAAIEVIDPDHFFPENEGIGVTPANLRSWVQSTPRTLDWVADHFDVSVDQDGRVWKGTDEIKAEEAVAVAEYQLTTGDVNFFSPGLKAAMNERNVYKRHVRVREAYQMPTRQYPLGRMAVVAGNVVLVDDDLMAPCSHRKGEYYPKVKLCAGRFWTKDGEFFSQGLPVPLISPQNRLNMSFSQITDNRERNSTDSLLLPKGMRLLSPSWLKNFSGRAVVYDVDPELPNITQPGVLRGRLMDQGVYQETDRVEQHMRDVAGQPDVDVGNAPKNVDTATGIRLLQEKSSERRQQRELELKYAFQELFSHQLLLLSEKVREPREYEAEGQGKSWEVKEFEGLDLAGLTDVSVDEEAAYDMQAYERESVLSAINLGLFKPESPVAQRATLDAIGVPKTLMDESNVQIDDAERKWFNFKNTQTIPPIDETLDSHFIHWQVYGKMLKGEDGQECIEKSKWNEILPLLFGWEDKLAMAEAADQMARQLPQLQQQAAQMGAPVPQIPQEQLDEMLLPPALPDRILLIWSRCLAAGGKSLVEETDPITGKPVPGSNYQLTFMRFRAVAETHRILAQGRKAAAGAGAPIVAAPGGGMTASGTEPTPTGPGMAPPPSTLGAGSQMGAPNAGPAGPGPM